MSVVGVDLGYQNSLIAAAGRGGVDVILNGNSNRQNPSMVGFSENRKMGEHALSGVTSNYKNTITGMKRLVGLPFDSPATKAELKHYPGVKFVPHAKPGGGPATIAVEVQFANETKVLPVEHVAGMMIHHMGMIVAQKAASESKTPDVKSCFPQDWVVAIPPYYTDAQRRALLAGCEMVGITSVQRLMHENTATALAYGIFKDLKKEFTAYKPTNVMFIDMGASAYNVSVACFEPGKLKVLSCYSDTNLGGRDFDLAIGEWVAEKFVEKYSKKLTSKPMENAKTRIKILAASEKAKKTLSPKGVKEASINLEMLQDDLDFHISLTSDEYHKLCQPLLDRLEAPIRKCLEEANLEASTLSVCEVVGGSTRIGFVKTKIEEILGFSGDNHVSTTMNADEAVARGAALQSAILSPRFKVLPYDIQEAQPYPIEISWGKGEGDKVVMFDRGLSFPVTRRVTLKKSGAFTVKAGYQMPVSVEQYGLDPALGAAEIATFSIKAPHDSGEKKIRVNVKQDIHGVISLSTAQMVEEKEDEEAKEGGEGKNEGEGEGAEKKKKVIKTNLENSTTRVFDWSTAEVNKYNEIEVAMANTDRLVKETADMRNELESYIYDMRDKIVGDLGAYGTSDEKDAFTKLNEAMETWLYEDGFDAPKKVYAEKLAELKKLGGPMEKRFAEAEGRSEAQQSLQSALEIYQKWVNESQGDSKYAHITDEERQTVSKMVDEVFGWMYEMMDKQSDLPLNADPVLTRADMYKKIRELNDKCGPIMRKPIPKKSDFEKAAESAKNEEAAKNEGTSEPMDVDGKKDGEKMETD